MLRVSPIAKACVKFAEICGWLAFVDAEVVQSFLGTISGKMLTEPLRRLLVLDLELKKAPRDRQIEIRLQMREELLKVKRALDYRRAVSCSLDPDLEAKIERLLTANSSEIDKAFKDFFESQHRKYKS